MEREARTPRTLALTLALTLPLALTLTLTRLNTGGAAPPPLAAAPQSQQLGLGSLREKLATHVMCVTSRPGPRRSCRRANGSRTRSSKLVSLFQPFAPTEVWQHGHGNLKQLVTEWYKDDPAFCRGGGRRVVQAAQGQGCPAGLHQHGLQVLLRVHTESQEEEPRRIAGVVCG